MMNLKDRRVITDILIAVFNGRCWWCDCQVTTERNRRGHPFECSATIDHWRPRSCGGSDRTGNMILSCYRCNTERGPRMPRHWKQALRTLGYTTKPDIIAVTRSRRAERRYMAIKRERYLANNAARVRGLDAAHDDSRVRTLAENYGFRPGRYSIGSSAAAG